MFCLLKYIQIWKNDIIKMKQFFINILIKFKEKLEEFLERNKIISYKGKKLIYMEKSAIK